MLYTEMSDVTIDVTDSMAHSWVEIYIDEIGWFPVEVVPGFYDMEKRQIEETEEDEKIEEQNKQNYQDEACLLYTSFWCRDRACSSIARRLLGKSLKSFLRSGFL